jgi:phosphopantothenoylcysteine decarboxylase/phosphopantothenate--cysteine ligase
MTTIFKDKHILLGVTGSIACYKAVDLASKLTQAGALVDVILTESAQRFVTPLTFQSVTGRAVYTDMWHESHDGLPTHIAHVGLGEDADLFIIRQYRQTSKRLWGMAQFSSNRKKVVLHPA